MTTINLYHFLLSMLAVFIILAAIVRWMERKERK
jgi:hypothetical protein